MLAKAWRRALTAEVCWFGEGERPHGLPVTPLMFPESPSGGSETSGVASFGVASFGVASPGVASPGVASPGVAPCIALPYSQRALALEIAAAGTVVLSVTDARSLSRPGTAGLCTSARVSLHEDLQGSVFTEHLLSQELVKYPPSRTLADSLLLRSENWWWLPRLLLLFHPLGAPSELPARSDPTRQAVLLRGELGAGGATLPRVQTVEMHEPGARPVVLSSLDRRPVRGDGGPALLLSHDYSGPEGGSGDFERWEATRITGVLRGELLDSSDTSSVPGAPLAPLSLLQRMGRHRKLHRDCLRGLAESTSR